MVAPEEGALDPPRPTKWPIIAIAYPGNDATQGKVKSPHFAWKGVILNFDVNNSIGNVATGALGLCCWTSQWQIVWLSSMSMTFMKISTVPFKIQACRFLGLTKIEGSQIQPNHEAEYCSTTFALAELQCLPRRK